MTESAAPVAPASAIPAARREPGFLDFVMSLFAIAAPLLCVGGLTLAFLGREELARGVKPDPAEIMTPGVLFFQQAFVASLTIFVCWLFACWRYGRTFLEGFAIRPVPSRTIRMSVLLGLVLPFGIVLLPISGESPMQKLQETTAGFVLIAFAAVTMPPVEEIFFRGFMFPIFRRYARASIVIALVTVIFGTLHAGQLTGEPFALLYVTFVGMVFTIQRHVTDSLMPSLVTHLTYNGSLVTLGVIGRIVGVEA